MAEDASILWMQVMSTYRFDATSRICGKKKKNIFSAGSIFDWTEYSIQRLQLSDKQTLACRYAYILATINAL
jgi:hypothetical protein